jgi:hypothetical protein
MKVISTAEQNAALDTPTRLRVLRGHLGMWVALAVICQISGVLAGLSFAGIGLAPTTGVALIGAPLVLLASLWALGRKL